MTFFEDLSNFFDGGGYGALRLSRLFSRSINPFYFFPSPILLFDWGAFKDQGSFLKIRAIFEDRGSSFLSRSYTISKIKVIFLNIGGAFYDRVSTFYLFDDPPYNHHEKHPISKNRPHTLNFSHFLTFQYFGLTFYSLSKIKIKIKAFLLDQALFIRKQIVVNKIKKHPLTLPHSHSLLLKY